MKTQILSGTWHAAMDQKNIGRAGKWFLALRPESKPVSVPGVLQQVFPVHQGVSWYWCEFTLLELPAKNERAILQFGSVEYLAEVWMNGTAVGGHEGAETPFEMDVTKSVRSGKNILSVRVLKPGNERVDGLVLSEIPHRCQYDQSQYQPGRLYNISGITGHVRLMTVPAIRIADIFARPDISSGKIDITVTMQNDTSVPVKDEISLRIGPAAGGGSDQAVRSVIAVPRGRSDHEFSVAVPQARPWNLDDPFLYRVSACIGRHEHSVRCGFREFRIEDGYFHLNGKRIFLKSSHTANHFPISQILPPEPDLMRRDLLMAKTSGFNCIRFIAGVALPEQLDFCDEIGLMVYEENLASWALGDSPQLTERYERSCREMILRDRNHPCITIWGLINEMCESPVFQCAVNYLPKLRELDRTRLVLLGSGRWDANPKIGSASNPGSGRWEHVWGVEGPDAPEVDKTLAWAPGGYIDRAGDAHFYPPLPMENKYRGMLRNFGKDTRPVFLSEFGIGSQNNAIEELKGFDRFDVPSDLQDRALLRSMAGRFNADWKKFGFGGIYPFPVDFFRDSYRCHSLQRRLNFDLIRSNPRLCGYNLTGLLDHVMTGEGLWSFWRRWKTGIAEVLEDGWSSLRWCLFADPAHGYAGQPIQIEAVLANENAMRPGRYPVTFRIWNDSEGVVWERRTTVHVEAEGELAVPVLRTKIRLDLPAGQYTFAADLERGGAPTGDRLTFQVAELNDLPKGKRNLYVWGLNSDSVKWLKSRGFRCNAFVPGKTRLKKGELVLTGDVPATPENLSGWESLKSEIMSGANILVLGVEPFIPAADKSKKLPWGGMLKSRNNFHDWLYHRESVGRRHAVFTGLQSGGILDWHYWGGVVGHASFDSSTKADEVIAASFAVGYCCDGGYESGILIARRRWGRGQLVINAMPVLYFLGRHPAADRLLLNLIDSFPENKINKLHRGAR